MEILKISTDHGYNNDFIATDDQVTNALDRFRNHPSIIIIKKCSNLFFWSRNLWWYFEKGKYSWHCKNLSAIRYSNLNFKTKFRLFCRIFLPKYQPMYLKINIQHKKKSKNFKGNYWPVSILSNMSKIY